MFLKAGGFPGFSHTAWQGSRGRVKCGQRIGRRIRCSRPVPLVVKRAGSFRGLSEPTLRLEDLAIVAHLV